MFLFLNDSSESKHVDIDMRDGRTFNWLYSGDMKSDLKECYFNNGLSNKQAEHAIR